MEKNIKNLYEYCDGLNSPIEAFVHTSTPDNFPILPHWHYFFDLGHAARRADIDIQRTAQSVLGKRFPHRAAAAHTGHGAGRVLVLCPFVFQISFWIKFNIEFVHFLFLS